MYFYSKIIDERTGKTLSGFAAMNYRLYAAGGMNNVAPKLIEMGVKMGYQNALQTMKTARGSK